jgi:hypothetical protein
VLEVVLHVLAPEVLGDTLAVSPKGTVDAPLLMRSRLRLPAVRHHPLPCVMLEHVLSSHTLLGVGAPLGCRGLGRFAARGVRNSPLYITRGVGCSAFSIIYYGPSGIRHYILQSRAGCPAFSIIYYGPSGIRHYILPSRAGSVGC